VNVPSVPMFPSWNRYVYAKNNPLATTDPNGADDNGDDGDSSDCGTCATLVYNGDGGTVTSIFYNSSGQMVTDIYNPWGGAMAKSVFTNPVLAQAGKSMNVVTAGFGGMYATLGGGAAAEGAGLFQVAQSALLIYGVPLGISVACGEFCGGISALPTAAPAIEEEGAGVAPALGNRAADLGNKLDFILGRATGRQHNIDRSVDMLRQLESRGLFDSPATREYLTEHLNQVLNDPTSIVKVMADGSTVRQSFLMGPNGGLMLETVWKGNQLKTAMIYGSNR